MNERAIFDAALDIQDLAKRDEFVRKACANDPSLFVQVSALLQAHDMGSSFLDRPVVDIDMDPSEQAIPSNSPDKTSDFSLGPAFKGVQGGECETKDIDPDEADDAKIDLTFLSPPTKPDSIGSLGHYEILKILGQGGFGIVFQAFDQKLHRLVAIKVMNPEMAATSPPRKRFLREARAVAAIKNENIVQVYSVEEQPLPYMVMEFIDGQTLQDRLDGDGPLEIEEILELGRQMATALSGAHALGIIHRDIKPGNILLERGVEPKVKITDFGLARAADDASMTRSGMISGTPMYMAPEQALGKQLDHRSDLFSLGSVLYQMACGRAPFRAPTAIAVLLRVAEDTPRPLQEILPSLPDWLVAVVNKLHAKNPEDRFATAKEVADLLGKYKSEILQHGKVTSFAKTPASISSSSTKALAQTKPNQSVGSSSSDPKNTRLLLAMSAIACMVLIGLLVPFLISRKQDNPTQQSQGPADKKSETADRLQPIASDDRAVAKWVLALPGKPSFQIEGQADWVSKPEELPSGTIKLTNVQLFADSDFGDEGLIRLGACEKLNRLGLNGGAFSGLTDEGFLKFAQLPAGKSIVGLDIWAEVPQLTDRFIDALNKMPRLERVFIPGSKVSDIGMQRLNLPNLKSVAFWGNSPAISSQSLVGLNQRSPECLELAFGGGVSLSNDSLAPLSAFPNLRFLWVESADISSEALEVVAKLPNLVTLRMGHNKKVGNDSMRNIALLKDLEELRVNGTGITDRACEWIASLPKLKKLDIDDNAITDAGLEEIAKISSLEYLRLVGCKNLTEAGVRKLRGALPKCEIESDFPE